jgi:hypothetical protein
MARTGIALIFAAGLSLAPMPLAAQNLISQGGWEGFAMRRPDGRFDRCVLYNRTVPALNASPYGMLGITRDGTGNTGLLVFFEPRSLTREAHTTVRMRIDTRPEMSLAAEAVSDFHLVVPGPLDTTTIAALRDSKALEFTAGAKSQRIAVTDVAAVLDRLKTCVEANAR